MDIKKIFAKYTLLTGEVKQVAVADTDKNKIIFNGDNPLTIEFNFIDGVSAIKVNFAPTEKITALNVFFPFKAKNYVAFYVKGGAVEPKFYKKSNLIDKGASAVLTGDKKEFSYFLSAINDEVTCTIAGGENGVTLLINGKNGFNINTTCLYTAFGLDPYEASRLATNALIKDNGLTERVNKSDNLCKTADNVPYDLENIPKITDSCFYDKPDIKYLVVKDSNTSLSEYIKAFGFSSFYINEYCFPLINKNNDDEKLTLLKAISGSDNTSLSCDAPLLPLANCVLEDPLVSKKPFILTNLANNEAVVACFNLTDKKVVGKFRPFQFLDGNIMDGYVLFDHYEKAGRIISHMEGIKVTLEANEFSYCTLTRIVNGRALVGFIDKYVKSKTYYIDEYEGYKTNYTGEIVYWSFDGKITVNGITIEGEKKGDLYYATL